MSDPAALFGFDPPEIDESTVLAIAREHWNLTGASRRIRGERSHNTHITGPDGSGWVLQVQSASERPDVVDLQARALIHVAERAPAIPVSRVAPTLDGAIHASVEIDGRVHLARLVSFLPGVTFDPVAPLPAGSYRAIGELIGRIAAALDDFAHPAANHFMPWDIGNGLVVDGELRRGLSGSSLAALRAVDERLHRIVGEMPSLPHRTIHNDGHAGNLIRPDATSHQVTGVIDFGDLVHTATAADVAIIAESFAPDHPDPAAVVSSITAGYHRHLALTEAELAALPDLVLARSALNVLLAEYQIRHAPHLAPGASDALQSVVERLMRWSRIHPGAMIDRITDQIEHDR